MYINCYANYYIHIDCIQMNYSMFYPLFKHELRSDLHKISFFSVPIYLTILNYPLHTLTICINNTKYISLYT